MQVPTSATGHEEEALAAATGHEEAQATATEQEKKPAATGDNEQALAKVSVPRTSHLLQFLTFSDVLVTSYFSHRTAYSLMFTYYFLRPASYFC